MTGAGFGGCTIALVASTDSKVINKLMDDTNEIYHEKTGIYYKYYYCESSDKTGRME
jgi:galactokinase